MASDFQIQEMVHQDADGVLFQALDKQTGRLVALRRFFLSDDVVAKLKVKGEDGKSEFERSLDWLKAVDVPNLQKVVGGGFDELDETPFLVTEWVEGMSLEEALEQESVAPGEGERFEGQARAVLLALPEETRPSICLEEDEILVRRDASGGLDSLFLVSPVRYFGALGGMEFKEQDRQAALVELRARFPVSAASAQVSIAAGGVGQTTGAAPAALPELKSAKQSSGMGMIWAALAAVVLVGGVGAWAVMSKRGESEDEASLAQNNAQKKEQVEGGELAQEEEEEDEEVIEPASPVVAATDSSNQVDRLKEQVRRAQESLEEEESVAMVPPSRENFEVEEKRPEGEVDLFEEEDDEEEEPEMASKVEEEPMPESTGLPVVQSATEVDQLRKLIGKKVVLEGVVEKVAQSGGKKTIWYLEFNKGTSDFMMVAFKHVSDKQSGGYPSWIKLTNKKVRVRGEAQMITRGGRRPAIIMARRAHLEVLADMKVRGVTELPALFESGSYTGEVIAEGTLERFGKSEKAGYLIFEEAPGVQARFWLESDFGSSEEFRKKMGALKGKKIRVTGPLQDDPQNGVRVALQIESPDKVKLCE